MTQPFLDVQPTPDPAVFRLEVTDQVCVGPPGNVFMFGGVGLGAATIAAERATGRSVIWSSAQFVSYARVGDTLDLSVEVLSGGRNISQVRVLGTDAGKLVLTVNAALGDREGLPSGQWVTPPEMPPAAECKPRQLWPVQDAALMDRLDVRLAPGRYGAVPLDGTPSPDGRMVVWIRAKDGAPIDASLLAIFADFVPSGLASAFGRRGGGNSLDNTLRIARIVPTDWVLCDVKISAADRGFGHGAIHMFAEDGTMMASGSQSAILRFMDPV
ncbi:thioesterase family protein [Sphingomonas sp. IC-11]|uniref:acyl-CoA thioesterase n=1 Tax=Sphingomonas sp. IC-11 TaxID=2898528 RepID=UPI001E47148B|nr:acyl-CoA thioesterase domain-containing protein [Sphingomonas sp. IC-11]MCD2317215.1 thioesterase family protein [Sphingomonas sp. IC-11]